MSDDLMRRVLWTSAAFNLGGALMFAFPASIGRLAALPVPVPTVYSVLLALFVTLFGGAYAWAASQPRIDRPMVALGAIGKSSAFAATFACWLAGEAPTLAVLALTGDLGFAMLFGHWLFAPERTPSFIGSKAGGR